MFLPHLARLPARIRQLKCVGTLYSNFNITTAQSSQVWTLTGGASAGTTVVLLLGQSNNRSITSVTDSKGNTYTVLQSGANTNGVGSAVAMCKLTTALVAGDTVTTTYNSTCDCRLLHMTALSRDVVAVDVTGIASVTVSDTAPTVTSPALNRLPELVIGTFCTQSGITTATMDSSFVSLVAMPSTGGSVNRNLYAGWKQVRSKAAVTYSGTLTEPKIWAGTIAAFR